MGMLIFQFTKVLKNPNFLIFNRNLLKLSLTCFSHFSTPIKTNLISGWTSPLKKKCFGSELCCCDIKRTIFSVFRTSTCLSSLLVTVFVSFLSLILVDILEKRRKTVTKTEHDANTRTIFGSSKK